MKFVGTQTRKNLGDMTKFVPDVISGSFTILNTLLEVAPVCVSEEEFVKTNTPVSEYAFHQLDILENLLALDSYADIETFASSLACQDMVTTRRLTASVDFRKKLLALAEKVTTAYIPLSEAELKNLNKLIRQAIGHLSMFLYSQFDMSDTLSDVERNEEPTVNIDVYRYAETVKVDVIELEKSVEEAMVKYRPNLPVFEEFPELEEEFYDIAGPYLQDFELLEDLVTTEDVRLVLNEPNIDLESLIETIKSRGNVREESGSDAFSSETVRNAFSGNISKMSNFD